MPNIPEAACVQLRDGRLHIPGAVYDSLLPGCLALALMVRDGRWVLLPLTGGAGGLQIKIRNLRGDRVVESQEFFRAQGLEDARPPCDLELIYDAALGGFLMQS